MSKGTAKVDENVDVDEKVKIDVDEKVKVNVDEGITTDRVISKPKGTGRAQWQHPTQQVKLSEGVNVHNHQDFSVEVEEKVRNV